jgi:hypothetical protein
MYEILKANEAKMSNEEFQSFKMSFSEILRLSENQDGEREEVARVPRSRVQSGDPESRMNHLKLRLSRLKLPTIPPTPGKTPQDEIKNRITEIRRRGLIVPIGSIPRDYLDKRATSIKQKKLACFSTNEMTFTNFGKDGEFFNVAKQYDPDQYPDQEEEHISALEHSTTVIGSSGSMDGLLTRINVGLSEAPRVSLDVQRCVNWAASVLEYKRVEMTYDGKSLAEVLGEVSGDLTFNPNSSAGVPYYGKLKDIGVMKSAVEVGTDILNALARGDFNKLVTEERPSLMAVLLRNKQDYYDLAKLNSKIRPYFVYPLHERLLYSAMQCQLKAVRFDESDSSGSAVGFSWNYGGGDRLYAWIMRQAGKGTGFYPCFYGDDQLWVVVTGWGQVFVYTPDFSHMDLSLCSQWGQVAYRMWRPIFRNLDKTWESVLKLNCKRAFVKQVIIDGALCFQFKHGLGSGVPGTTKFDEVASAAVNGYVKEMYEERMSAMHSVDDLAEFMTRVAGDVRTKFGLIFKEGSLTPYPFIPEQSAYEFVFLGQSLVRIAGRDRRHYIPKPQLTKLMVSATTYKKSYKSPMLRQKASMHKYRSLYAGGGYLYPIFAGRLAALFDSMEKRGLRPLIMEDEEFASESEGSIFMDIPFQDGDASWPTSEWCMNLFLPPDDSLAEHSGASVKDRLNSEPGDVDVVLQTPDFDLDEFDIDMDEEIANAVNPKGWSDQMALEREPEDVGVSTFQDPREVPMKFMAQTQPLSAAKKKEFEEARERERAEKRAALEARRALKGVASSAGVKKGSRGRKGALTVADFDEGQYELEDEYESEDELDF